MTEPQVVERPDAATLVLRDLLDAAVAEDLAGLAAMRPGPGPQGRPGSWVTVSLPDDEWLAWPVRGGGALAATRYDDGPVLHGGRAAAREIGPSQVVALLAPRARFGEVVARDVDAAVTHTLGLEDDPEVLAAARGRPFHPSARAVAGWSRRDLARWGPGREVALDWVAVRRDHLRLGDGAVSRSLHTVVVPGAEPLVADPEYQPLPVHPADREHVLPATFAREIADGLIVPLARGVGSGRATASLRTLDLGEDVHLKLPLGVTTLGSARLLPPRYLDNSDRAERMLRRVLSVDPVLAGRVAVAEESTWAGWAVPDGSDEFDESDGRPGRLAAQIRRLPPARGTRLPLAALAAPAWGRGPLVTLGDPEAVLTAVIDAVVEVGVGFLRHGVLPEMHGQNVLLDVSERRVRLVLRDHDAVRIHPRWLSVPDPGYRIAPGGTQSLRLDSGAALTAYFQTLAVEIGLYGAIDAVSRHLGVREERFWTVVRRAVARAVENTSAPEIRSTLHATLLTAETWPYRSVLRPLLERGPSRGASMPAGWARIPNPLRHR